MKKWKFFFGILCGLVIIFLSSKLDVIHAQACGSKTVSYTDCSSACGTNSDGTANCNGGCVTKSKTENCFTSGNNCVWQDYFNDSCTPTGNSCTLGGGAPNGGVCGGVVRTPPPSSGGGGGASCGSPCTTN